MADHYEILGVSRSASSAEIRKAYLVLARERHPDRFSDPAEKEKAQEFFKNLTGAFNTLSNDRSRREYDEELARPKLTTPEEIARDAYARGMAQLAAKQYHDAVELLRTAVQLVPKEAAYQAALGRGLSKNPRWVREAIQALEKAIALEPQQAAFHASLAELYHGQGLALRAHKALETAQQLSPQDPEVKRVAGLLASGESGS